MSHKYKEDRLRRHLLSTCPHLPEGALELLETMLTLDPTKRISAEKAFLVSSCQPLCVAPVRLLCIALSLVSICLSLAFQ